LTFTNTITPTRTATPNITCTIISIAASSDDAEAQKPSDTNYPPQTSINISNFSLSIRPARGKSSPTAWYISNGFMRFDTTLPAGAIVRHASLDFYVQISIDFIKFFK
jgi:hypothetical protein